VVITARYATICGICGDAVGPGDRIQALPSGSRARWAHHACAPDNLFGEQTAAGPAVVSAAPTAPHGSALPTTQVWTDGACSGNPGPGGWAWATADGRQSSGGSLRTTNQRMEIQPALEAVTALAGPLLVVSDSTYLVNCFRDGWWRGWIARNWVTSAKKPVANRDLWEPLVAAVREREEITFRWIKGHSGDRMNDLVDRLAVEAAASHAGLA
jgi:ribonuclease HI